MELDSAETAAEIMKTWNEDFAGTKITSVSNPKGKLKLNAVVVDRLDKDAMLGEQTSGQLDRDIEKVTIRGFNKKPRNG